MKSTYLRYYAMYVLARQLTISYDYIIPCKCNGNFTADWEGYRTLGDLDPSKNIITNTSI